jgi:hypothetical protein
MARERSKTASSPALVGMSVFTRCPKALEIMIAVVDLSDGLIHKLFISQLFKGIALCRLLFKEDVLRSCLDCLSRAAWRRREIFEPR